MERTMKTNVILLAKFCTYDGGAVLITAL